MYSGLTRKSCIDMIQRHILCERYTRKCRLPPSVDVLTSTWPRVSVCGGDMVPRCDLCSAGTPGSVVWDTCSGDHRQGGRQDATDRYTNTISRWCGYHHPSIIVCCDGMGPILMTCDVSQITLPSSAFSRTWLGQYQRWYYFTCLNNKQYLGW